jgi:hypothetical protein
MRSILFAISVIAIGSALPAQAKMYKWVDENGQVHFGDKVPQEYLKLQHDVLNEQGVKIDHKERAKTEAELAEEQRLEKERKKQELVERKKKQRDRVLLDTYTTERDLVVARDSRLEAVDSQIQLAKNIISDSKKNLELLEKQVTEIKASNRTVPDQMYERIANGKQQVKLQQQVLEQHKKRHDDIAVQFNGYIERFKVLKAEQKAKREQLARERGEL